MKQRLVSAVQRIVVRFSYALAARRPQSPVDWVIGPFEVAGMARDLRAVIPHSIIAVLVRHPMYDDAYDVVLRPSSGPLAGLVREWRRAVLLGRLAARTKGFVYLSDEGFLSALGDRREHEFRFLSGLGKRIVCVFTGSDIRSPALMRELEEQLAEPNLGTYLREVVPAFSSPRYEAQRRRTGEVADEFADLIITARVDQRGHISRPVEPFRYFFPRDEVIDEFAKFRATGPSVVVHAPSSPVIKGTQLVRAAVATLRDEGHDFEYVELIGVTNTEVREQLRRAHIVLNQFYSYVPSVFGIEAMASCCAVLMRADPAIETDLPDHPSDAWWITRHHEVVDHLRRLLEDRALAERYARAGREWVLTNATSEATGPALRMLLDDVLAHGMRDRVPTGARASADD